MMKYRCPYCHLPVQEIREIRYMKDESPEWNLEMEEGENRLSEEEQYEEGKIVRLFPCGHRFPHEEYDYLRRTLRQIEERKSDLTDPDLTEKEFQAIRVELHDLQEQAERMRCRLAEDVIVPDEMEGLIDRGVERGSSSADWEHNWE